MDIEVFENAEFGTVSVFERNGEPCFIAKDVCGILGTRTDSLRSILDEDEVFSVNPNSIGVEQSGGRDLLSITESGFYRLVMKSRKPEAKSFQRWVTHEVLPSIRRSGGYISARSDETPEQLMARALVVANEAMQRQRRELDEMRPKALFADAVAASDGTCLVGELAKMLRQNGVDVGQNRLFAWLRRDGYLGTVGGHRNVPTQRAMEQGLFRIKETAVTHSDGHVTISRTPKVTGKGQRLFIERYGKGAE